MTDIQTAIANERAFQRGKYGDTKHDLALWVLIMERELAEVKEAIIKKTYDEARKELLQVVAVGHAALEQHGAVERDVVMGLFKVHRGGFYFERYQSRQAKALWTKRFADAAKLPYEAAARVCREEEGAYLFLVADQ